MTGTYRITREMLVEHGACDEGLRFFDEHHPEGDEYQKVLDTAVNAGRTDYALWLFGKIGHTEDVLWVSAIDDEEKCVVFAGSIKAAGRISVRSIQAGGSIDAGGSIKAGEYIEAGGSIKAGRSIQAGEYINAGWYINAGEYIEAGRFISAGPEFGIYAGLNGRITETENRKIICPIRPENIMCGVWEQAT